TVREYALAHLERAGEAAAVRRRHLRWCVRLAEAWEAGFRGPGQPARLAGLAAKLDDLWGALDWAAAAGAAAEDPGGRAAVVGDGLRLAAALRWFWIGAGIVQEARDRTEALLRLARAAPEGGPLGTGADRPERAGALAGALGAAGHLRLVGGDFAET